MGAAANPIEFIGAFESAYQPAFDVDNFESTGHDRQWRADLGSLVTAGVRRTRYPVRWHRLEDAPGRYDWKETDTVLGWLQENNVDVIVDLVHHTSYPRWLNGFTDPRFAESYLAYLEAFANRYPDIEGYTLFNEPFTTFLLSGDVGIWPPHLEGLVGFATLAKAILPVVAEASRRFKEFLPNAEHVYVDSCERHVAGTDAAEEFTDIANDRRFFILDAFLGRAIQDEDRPFLQPFLEAGGEDLLAMAPGALDVLGLDYYAHCQWEFTGPGGEGHMHASRPDSLAWLLVEYAERYELPVMLGETNIRGYSSDRASWLKYTLEQCEAARDAGIDVRGYCWFPFVDSCDWDSVLTEHNANIDPVGVYWLDESRERHRSCMSDAYALAAGGAPSSELPAYRFREPVATWLQGWLPQMSHWDWQDPPIYDTDPPMPVGPIDLRIEDAVE
jgi:beta-glucosidase/6-phospho-beta-glucosidase/beta-galactosidase